MCWKARATAPQTVAHQPSGGCNWRSKPRDRVAPDRPVAIAGSMSNNVAWLPGTVVPDPDYLPSPEQESANYREMAETLAEAGCDLLLMEMLQDVEHARRVTEAAVATGLPVWAGISTSRGADGEMTGWNQSEEEEEHRLPDDYEHPAPAPLTTIIDSICALGPTAVGIMHSSLPCTTPGARDPVRTLGRPGHGVPRSHGHRSRESSGTRRRPG